MYVQSNEVFTFMMYQNLTKVLFPRNFIDFKNSNIYLKLHNKVRALQSHQVQLQQTIPPKCLATMGLCHYIRDK